ncbi:MAG: beta-galactosidase trimerization domain-containing protein, partial [Candidatus Hydrogenedentes bacterium]|nr:beta-galactosidase trimerization domain-containing protein [Candidatus Hydrogenedentota bacterium]
NLGPSNTGSRNELVTYAGLEGRMREVADAGYNTVINNGLHFRLCHPDEMAMMTANMKRTCDVAHRYGLRVIEHHDVPIMQAHNQGFKTLLAHTDWLERDIESGKVCTEFCINNPGFLQWYYEWFRDYARATGIDGAMLDEVSFFGPEFCGCAHCRARFTRDTGLALPYRDAGEVFHNRDSALWIAWEKQRVRSSSDFFRGIRAIFDECKPSATLMAYTTHYGFTSSYGSRRYGGDIVDRARYIDFLGTEIMSRNVFYSHRSVFAFRKAKAALGLYFQKPIWGLVYHLDDPDLAYFGWALLQMNRQVGWIPSIEGFDIGRFINWDGRMNARDAVPLSDVAIVFSRACCNYNRRTSHASSAMGWSQQLSDGHIQHDIILDLGLTAEALARYRVVILPDVECLSDEAAAALDAYVEAGGRLFVTRWAGQLNEDGIPREAGPALACLDGIEVGDTAIKGPLNVQSAEGDPFIVDAAASAASVREGTEVLAWSVDENDARLSPAIARRPAGAGQIVYLAVPLGAVNCMREYTVGDTYEFAVNEPARDLLWGVLRATAGEPFAVEAIQVPEQVFLAAYEVPEGYAIHLLNATGARLAPGESIPRTAGDEPFPPLPDDIVFDLRVPAVSSGRLVSPDYDRERRPGIEKWDDRYRITVPRDALHAYAVVYLEGGEPR